MSGSKSDYLEDKVLDHILGGPDYTRPATVYAALYTASPIDVGGGIEVSGGGYERVAITNNSTNWPPSVGGTKTNGTDIVFPVATASWGTIEAVGLLDAPTGGNLLYWATLDTPKAVGAGDTARISAGAFVVSEN